MPTVSRRALFGLTSAAVLACGSAGCSSRQAGRSRSETSGNGPSGSERSGTGASGGNASGTGASGTSDGAGGVGSASSSTVSGGSITVTGTAAAARLREVRDDAAHGLRTIRQVWGAVQPFAGGAWRLQVPATDAEFTADAGSGAEGSAIAATTRTDGVIVLSPTLWTKVTAPGRQVVITHELTHVALRQTSTTRAPRWVIEGSADYTAYTGSGLSLARVAPQLAAQIRGGTRPSGPPADAAFTTSDPGVAYQSAYAYCQFLAQRFGQARFTSFVRASATGGSAAFEQVFGATTGPLSEPYRTYLSRTVAG